MQQVSRAFRIHDLAVGSGRVGVSRLPGRNGDLAGDIEAIRDWGAAIVLSMTTEREMADTSAGDLGPLLAAAGIE